MLAPPIIRYVRSDQLGPKAAKVIVVFGRPWQQRNAVQTEVLE